MRAIAYSLYASRVRERRCHRIGKRVRIERIMPSHIRSPISRVPRQPPCAVPRAVLCNDNWCVYTNIRIVRADQT